LLNSIVDEYHLADKLAETHAISAWAEVLGPLAKSTEQIYLNKRTLFVRLSSSAIRNELLMRRSDIIRLLNEKLAKPLVDQIVFC
jgi:predicted nucleic acid-binding Zn ribbon protein